MNSTVSTMSSGAGIVLTQTTAAAVTTQFIL